DERQQIAGWLEVQDIAQGKRLARQGRSDYQFFVLEAGQVRVELEGQTLRTLGPGDVFGEIAFFVDGRRTADVIADTDARVLTMFGTRFRERQLTMPDLAARRQGLVQERTQP